MRKTAGFDTDWVCLSVCPGALDAVVAGDDAPDAASLEAGKCFCAFMFETHRNLYPSPYF